MAIELLSPAKNLEVGQAAVNHGADAVYIGASQFGARHAAGNSIADIEALVNYAHRYHVRVYVTLNTILRDDELEAARLLVGQLYDIGVDALIIQDMALLEMSLPPIALHASTQCDNRTLEKVLFLEKCGFEQVVLARETPLVDIRRICEKSNVKIETFVHGALCVSYSGLCYMSEAQRGRSANRGECTQMCRLPFDLIDASGRELLQGKHLLSLKDFDASAHLRELVDAGVSSLKIEGRLKDDGYVKNITAYYRCKLDAILEGRDVQPASLGRTTFFFTPNPQKTFFRGATDYFLSGRQPDIWSFKTNKSFGEEVGCIRDVRGNSLLVSMGERQKLANGDGLCFLNRDGKLEGFRVNRVDGGRLFPLRMPCVERGMRLYRNEDVVFSKQLLGVSSQRRIEIDVKVSDTQGGVVFSVCYGRGTIDMCVDMAHEEPHCEERSVEAWRTQLSKFGDSAYQVRNIDLSSMEHAWFVPVSQLASWRRELVVRLDNEIIASHPHPCIYMKPTSHPFIGTNVDYSANIYNRLARRFYERHGVRVEQMAYEAQPVPHAPLMTTRHCIRYALGLCQNYPLSAATAEKIMVDKKDIAYPLKLRLRNDVFCLHFDCKRCVMLIHKE